MSEVKLVKYDAACKAIAAAKNVDEVKHIRDVSIAMKAYARQSRNHDLEADAIEIRMRATRRMDQMRQEQKATVGLAKGTRGAGRPRIGGGKNPPPKGVPTLAEAGIGKDLAKEGRKLGALSSREFEKAVKTARESVGRVVKDALRADDKRDSRAEREKELAKNVVAMPGKNYGVIYADPPWRFEPYSRETGMDRSADNHYPTMNAQALGSMDIPAAKNCVLFLWATVPMLSEALAVMVAWKFEYKSHFVWDKTKVGTGYWNRNRHELLLIGVRGNVPAPDESTRSASLIVAPRGKHSEKPAAFRKMIEKMFPTVRKIELFARERVKGWDAFGNELKEAVE